MNLILVAFIVICVLKLCLGIKKRRDVGNKVQGPPGIPLIGNYQTFNMAFDELLIYLSGIQKQFKNYFKLWIGPEFWFVVYDPKLVETVLTDSSLAKSNDYKLLIPWLGKGLIMNEGKSWFSHRRAITPAFHFNILEDFIGVFGKHADDLIKKWPTDEVVDVREDLLHCAFDIICETSMGIDMNAQNSSYVKAVDSVARSVYKNMFNPFVIFRLTKDYQIFKKSLKIISETTQTVINSRRELLLENADPTESETGKRRKRALLDILLQSTVDGAPIGDKQIHDEVNTFLFAGHDTTGSTMGFLLYSVAKHHDVQNKVLEEVKAIFNGKPHNDDLTTANLNQLKYMDAVIKESMRLYATVPFIGRQIIKETTIGDVNLPADTNVSLYLFGMFRSEDLFQNPLEFQPQRFDTEYTAETVSPFAYLPFSAGPRNCIGQKFAMLEMKTVLLKIVTNFEVSLAYPEEELILEAGMVLKAKNGIKLKFKERKM